MITETCRICDGEGVVSAMEEVEAGNPATLADVGEEKCWECDGTGVLEVEEDIAENI